jgi:hypothetical protein
MDDLCRICFGVLQSYAGTPSIRLNSDSVGMILVKLETGRREQCFLFRGGAGFLSEQVRDSDLCRDVHGARQPEPFDDIEHRGS